MRRRSHRRYCGQTIVFLLGMCVLAAGCLTSSPKGSLERDGKRYGIVKGAFHSRWWNYYERGCSFADGAFWPEAERDLQMALALRKKDQLWPRTYGLHFLPEYFPHRELGVVLFHQDRLDEAASELEASLEQQFSARAAYFLNEARKRTVSLNKSEFGPPQIDVASVASPTATTKVRVSGNARAEAFLASITVNGIACPLRVFKQEDRFDQEITLAPGPNTVLAEVRDLRGRQARVSQEILVDLDGPAVSFDEPVAAPGAIRGVVSDTSGVSDLRIADQVVSLSPEGGGQYKFSFNCGAVNLKSPVVYEATDKLGNATRGPVPFKTVMLSQRYNAASFAAYAPSARPIAGALWGVYADDTLVAVTRMAAASESANALSASFSNVAAGRKYLLDEIAVGVVIEGAKPIVKATLNGAPLSLIPGRATQRLTRRVPLTPGPNRLELTAEDETGAQAAADVTVERQPSAVDQAGGRLNVAVLGNVWKGNSPQLENEASFIVERFQRELARRERFGLIDRSLLPEVLVEQRLNAALGSRDERLALVRLVPAELMIIGRVRRDANSIELVAEAISSETSLFVGRADVAGPANTLDELRQLVNDLALRFIQEFPRAQGQVALVKAPGQLVTNLGASQNLRESMKLVVFRYGQEILDPTTKESLGKDTLVLGDAIVESVDEKKSTAQRVVKPDQAAPEPIQVGDCVVVK